MEKRPAELILENGVRFTGSAFGDVHDVVGEVVFTTGMTGYQETLTDPSFAGQIVTMTYPLIGNYGINLEDNESARPALTAFIVREKCEYPNNFRAEMDLDGYLQQVGILGLEGIDTRALTRTLRDCGVMRGLITTAVGELSEGEIRQRLDSLDNRDVISRVTPKKPYVIEGEGTHIAFLDLGAKAGILRDLKARGSKLSVFPASASAEEILAVKPDMLFISNGPGDPKDVPDTLAAIRALIGKIPVRGICMGHQLIALALGCNTTKMKFGHHGGNHPVKDRSSGRIYITSQNHNYMVCDLPEDVEITFHNVNDGSVEGIRHKTLDVASVQFHPEASPGPQDTAYLFDEFLNLK